MISSSSLLIQIELVDGRYDRDGRVIMLVDGHWGAICGTGWDLIDATVACRQLGLGFAMGAPIVSHQVTKISELKSSVQRRNVPNLEHIPPEIVFK